ncbi:MAG: hypothetical protein LBC07_05455 [Elusimicrobiota bacterium]|jgi:hypothetical protein|nr:hypothetical protein [Elusimicrobiota bacterium]
MAQIIDREFLKKSKVGKVKKINLYKGSMWENLKSVDNSTLCASTEIVVKNSDWKDTEERAKLVSNVESMRETLKNAKMQVNSDSAILKDLMLDYSIYLARQMDEEGDYTSTLCETIIDENMPEAVKLQNYIDYVGKEKVIKGINDPIPLIEESFQNMQPTSLQIKAFRHKNLWDDLVFSQFQNAERLIHSIARIIVDSKNNECIGKIVAASYDSAHLQTADTTGTTFDLKIYNTIKKAIQKGLNLKHSVYPEKRLGDMQHQIYLLVNPGDIYDIKPIINSAIPIAGIIPYGGGLQDGLQWNNETLKYPGVERGTAYAVIKTEVGAYNFVKRNITLESFNGTLPPSPQGAWYRIGTTFMDWLINATIKITLPQV